MASRDCAFTPFCAHAPSRAQHLLLLCSSWAICVPNFPPPPQKKKKIGLALPYYLRKRHSCAALLLHGRRLTALRCLPPGECTPRSLVNDTATIYIRSFQPRVRSSGDHLCIADHRGPPFCCPVILAIRPYATRWLSRLRARPRNSSEWTVTVTIPSPVPDHGPATPLCRAVRMVQPGERRKAWPMRSSTAGALCVCGVVWSG